MEASTGSRRGPAALAEDLAAEASGLALLLDFDGTLAPIVEDPEAARPDDAAVEAVRRLAERLPLVACITGRGALTARRLLGVDEIAYAGLHGAELLAPGAAEPELPDGYREDGDRIEALVRQGESTHDLEDVEIERKGPIIALHWRRSPDPDAARRRAEALAERASAEGLTVGRGRSVLELRPSTPRTKGDALRDLVLARPAVRHVAVAGDDVTDLDAFAAARALAEEGAISGCTLVAVLGEGAPPEVEQAADRSLTAPVELGRALTLLATLVEQRPGGGGDRT